MAKERDAAVESFRVVLMLAILFLHVSNRYNGPEVKRVVDDIAAFGVVGFAFITGWFGLRFSPSKLIRLLGVLVYTQVIVLISDCWLFGTTYETIKGFLKHIKGFWFLWAYIAMMCIVPLINVSLEKIRNSGRVERETAIALVPFFGLVIYGWLSYVSPHALPRINGVSSYSFLCLLGVYVGARLLRCKVGKRDMVTSLGGGLCLLLLLSIPIFHLGANASPFTFAETALLFMFFRRARFLNWLAFFGKSTFSVYMLHLTASGFFLMDRINGDSRAIGFQIIVSCVLFAICALIDIPRRIFCGVAANWINKSCLKIDGLYEKSLEMCLSRMRFIIE